MFLGTFACTSSPELPIPLQSSAPLFGTWFLGLYEHTEQYVDCFSHLRMVHGYGNHICTHEKHDTNFLLKITYVNVCTRRHKT